MRWETKGSQPAHRASIAHPLTLPMYLYATGFVFRQ